MWKALIRVLFIGFVTLTTIIPAWATGTVARAQFATDVINREPLEEIGPIVQVKYGEVQRVYFFTDLRDFSGYQVVHRWKLDDDIQAEIAFDIGGDRWRVWSSKRLLPGFDGKWTVDILADGSLIESHSFDYVDNY